MKMNTRKTLVWIVLCVPIFDIGRAIAGDEVDYSAPYLTVENGELVTKYPANKHDEETLAAASADISEPARAAAAGRNVRRILLAVAALAAALMLIIRYGAKRRLRDAGGTGE